MTLNGREQRHEGFQETGADCRRAAVQTADSFVANQMKTLAEAFRAQAKVMRKKRKTKK